MIFKSHIKVRFGDEDHARIVYHPRFFDFFHQVFEDFFDDQGIPYQEVLDVDHVGWPAVHVEADFHSPLRFGDVMEVELWVERIGGSSAVLVHRGTRKGTGELIATAKITVACIDMQTFHPKPIPERYRELFGRFLEPPAA